MSTFYQFSLYFVGTVAAILIFAYIIALLEIRSEKRKNSYK